MSFLINTLKSTTHRLGSMSSINIGSGRSYLFTNTLISTQGTKDYHFERIAKLNPSNAKEVDNNKV